MCALYFFMYVPSITSCFICISKRSLEIPINNKVNNVAMITSVSLSGFIDTVLSVNACGRVRGVMNYREQDPGVSELLFALKLRYNNCQKRSY